MAVRTPIRQFELSNPLYKNAIVGFYTVASGVKTTNLAELYSGQSGVSQLQNPQKLNSHGQFKQPVYIDVPVIGVISGISAPGHDTAIINPAPTLRFSTDGTLEYSYDGGNTYFTAGTLGITTVGSLVSFIQSGIGSVQRTIEEKGRDRVDARDKGAIGDGATNDNAGLQALLNHGGRLVLGGGKTYKNSAANLVMVANTDLVIERGTTLHLDGTRLTASGVDNISITGGGKISSTSLNTTDPGLGGTNGRGIVEFVGTAGTHRENFVIEDVEVMADWVGTPGAILIGGGDKRKGIMVMYAHNATVRECHVHGVIAEAVYHEGALDNNILFVGNYVHDCNMDGLNFNEGTTYNCRMIDNYAADCSAGYEASAGTLQGNRSVNCGFGIGGGGATGPINWSDNFAIGGGFSAVAANPGFPVDMTLDNNVSINAPNHGFDIEWLRNVSCTNNKAYGWGQTTPASLAFLSQQISDTLHFDGNLAENEGANSGGGFDVLAVTGKVVFGTNHVSGVARPWVNTSGFGARPAALPCFTNGAPTSHTGDTNPFTLGTYTVLADSLRDSAGIEAVIAGTATNNANAKTLTISFGGSTIATLALASTAAWRIELELINTSNGNTQAYSYTAWAGTAVLSVGSGTLAIATTVAKDLLSSIALGSAGDTVTQNIMLVKPIVGFKP